MKRPVPILLLVSASLALVACKKGGGVSGEAGDQLSYIPGSAIAVGGISVKQARDTAVFGKLKDKFLSQLPPELTQLQEACGLNLINDIDTVVGGGSGGEMDAVIAVSGSFDKDKVGSCMQTMAEKDGKKITISENGKLTSYAVDGGDTIHLHWPNANTVVIAPGVTKDADAMAKLLDGNSVKENKAVMDIVGKVDANATFWAAGKVPPEAASGMAMMGSPPASFYLSVNVGSDVSVTIGLGYDKEEDAKQMSTMMQFGMTAAKSNPQAAQFKDILDTVKIDRDGAAVKITAKVTLEQIEAIVNMAAAMGAL